MVITLDLEATARAPASRWSLVQVAAAAAIVAMACITLWLGSTSEHLQRPLAATLYLGYLVTASTGVGLYWWRRRPASRFGPLLYLFGVLSWIVSWEAASPALPFDLGVLAEAPFFVLTFYLFLSFPMGRLEPRAARWLIGFLIIGVLAFFLPWALFAPVIAGGGPLTDCAPACPANVLQIATAPSVVEAAGKAETYAALAVTVATLIVYGRRVLTASRPQRRALAAVAVPALLFLPAYFVANFASQILDAGPALVRTLQWAIVVARVLIPLGFLVALLQADHFAAKALRSLLERLADRPTPDQWRAAVAATLYDPALRLGYHDAGGERFREPDGSTLDPESTRAGRAGVIIRKSSHPVATMDVDEALTEDPEFLRAAGLATLIAVENGALEGELQASRTRIADAQRAERERIGRDLHDGAQQRLIALRIRLSLLGEQLDHGEERAAVERIDDEVGATLAELRELAQGLTPPLLAHLGVGPALRAVADRSPVRVTIYDAGIGRHPEPVETAIYFSCLESLQNAAKHAGPGAFVSIHLQRRDDELTFSVQDDGAGFDPETIRTGGGLGNITSRVAALGGRVEIEAGEGRGTRVSGVVPR